MSPDMSTKPTAPGTPIQKPTGPTHPPNRPNVGTAAERRRERDRARRAAAREQRDAEYQARRAAHIKKLVDAAPPLSGDVLARLQVWATNTRRRLEAAR